jgi:SSS family solute:Na+ symporter
MAIAIFLSVTLFALRKSRGISEEVYLVGGRDVPWWLLGPTIAAGVLGGGVILVFSEYSYNYGFSALSIIGGIAIGTFFVIPLALKFKPMADRQRFFTFPDLFEYKWGIVAGNLATLAVFLWTLGFIVLHLISAGIIIQAMVQLPSWSGVLIVSAVVASYVVRSGFRAVVLTDFIQFAALLLLLIVVLPSTAVSIDWSKARLDSIKLDLATIIGFFLLGSLNMLVSADLWQRIYAARSPKEAKVGFLFAGILILIGGLLLLFPGLAANTLQQKDIQPNVALVEVLAQNCPRLILGFGLAAILMAVMASLDTMVFILGLTISHDIIVRIFGKPLSSRIPSAQLSMVLALLIGSIFAIRFSELLPTGVALSLIGLVLVPAIFMAAIGKDLSKQAVNGGIILGLLTVFSLIILGKLTPDTAPIALVAAILGSAIGASYKKWSD